MRVKSPALKGSKPQADIYLFEYFKPNPFAQPHSKIPNSKRKEKARYLPCSQIYFLFFGLPLHFLQTIYI